MQCLDRLETLDPAVEARRAQGAEVKDYRA